MIHPVILSGGSGTRLWPMSRSLYPKQLLALTGERSLLQETACRVAGDATFAPPLIVAVLFRARGVTTRAWSVRVACAPLARLPTVHAPSLSSRLTRMT